MLKLRMNCSNRRSEGEMFSKLFNLLAASRSRREEESEKGRRERESEKGRESVLRDRKVMKANADRTFNKFFFTKAVPIFSRRLFLLRFGFPEKMCQGLNGGGWLSTFVTDGKIGHLGSN